MRALWFGDERGYNATPYAPKHLPYSCGLVMKEDITQLEPPLATAKPSCGLVMKEDITQRLARGFASQPRCGLVMKEDITQRNSRVSVEVIVVVW